MDKLTASLEDYLEVICNFSNEKQKIRAVDISKKLNVSRASVTEALNKLANKGYLIYNRYDTITLTELGEKTAQLVISKHTILQTFFEKILGLDKTEASINACKIEHVITEKAFKQISNFIKPDLRDNEHF